MELESKCVVCMSPASQKCSGCRSVFYCSREHQKKAWKEHKSVCKPFKVCNDGVLGRHLVATRPIKSGEIILREAPLIWGPSQVTVPVCLGCGKLLTAQKCIPCMKCGWPMCGLMCQNNKSHQAECALTQHKGTKVSITNFGFPHPNYQCLTVLRCLYQRDENKELWQKLMKLQSHCEERKKTEKYENDRSAVARFIQTFFKLEDKFAEDEILRVCGILQVKTHIKEIIEDVCENNDQINGHEVPLTEPAYVAIYEHTSMFEHNCKANCSKSFKSNGDILITAGVPIDVGEHLSICYTDSLWGTPNRRHYLQETKFFSCSCLRCSDPTEFGTYFTALKCQSDDCSGFVLPETFLVDPRNDFDTPWKCNACDRKLTSHSVQNIIDRIGQDLQAMQKGDAKSCQLFLDYYGKLLHENHYYLTDVRIALGQLIGQDKEDGLSSVSDEEVQLKIKLCRQVTELVKVLNPAEVRVRGTLLFELHAALAETAKRMSNSSETDPDDFKIMLIKSKTILEKAIKLLQHEPDEMPEGKIAFQARRNLMELNNLLRSVHIASGNNIL